MQQGIVRAVNVQRMATAMKQNKTEKNLQMMKNEKEHRKKNVDYSENFIFRTHFFHFFFDRFLCAFHEFRSVIICFKIKKKKINDEVVHGDVPKWHKNEMKTNKRRGDDCVVISQWMGLLNNVDNVQGMK